MNTGQKVSNDLKRGHSLGDMENPPRICPHLSFTDPVLNIQFFIQQELEPRDRVYVLC